MTLAGHLGMSLKRCMQEVDAQEFHLWQVRHSIEPIGEARTDWQTATIAHAVVAMLRDPKKKAPDVSAFIPKYWKPKLTEEDYRARAREATEVIVGGLMQMRAVASEARRRRGEEPGEVWPHSKA